MLDVIRQRKGPLKAAISTIVLLVAASFVIAIFAVWGGGVSESVQGTSWIMSVDGARIPAAEFQRRRSAVEQDLREQLAGQTFDDQTLANLVDQQALGGILSFHLAQREAERAGLDVVPGEVSETIRSMPVFQRDGRFVGVDAYKTFLATQGLSLAEFESSVARELAADKVRLALFGIARADEREVEKRFRQEIERVDVDYVLLPDESYAPGGRASDSDLRSWYEEHSGDYMTEEARNASFVLFDREAAADSVEISEADLRQSYESLKSTRYTHGEQRRASHILRMVSPGASPEEEAAQEAEANDILAAIRSGADFAQIARERSEDTTSAQKGGDLGWFERERMVPEFSEAAFSLPVGSVSDVVRTSFGFHIIKATDSRPAGTRSFEEVREEIRRDLAVQKAQEQIRTEADAFTTSLASQTSSFEGTAAEAGLTVEETGFFSRTEPAGRLGRLPMVEDAVFSLAQGAHSAAVSVPQGLAVFSLKAIEPPRPEAFEEVREQVEKDWKASRSRELARRAAEQILERSGDLRSRVSGRKNLTVTSYAAVTRAQPMPPLTDAAKEAALLAEIGTVIGPFDSADGVLLLQATRRAPETQAEAEAEKEGLREQMLDEERTVLFQSVMARLQKNSEIEINQSLLRSGAVTQ